MNIKQRRELVEALLACPSISDRNKRDTVINDLPGNIKNNIQRDNADKFDVTNIVNACSNYPGGIDELIDCIEGYEGDSDSVQKVKAVWTRISLPGRITKEQLNDLLQGVVKANMPEDEILNLYATSVRETGFSPNPEAKAIWSMLQHLQDIPPQDDGPVAILHFAEQLSHQVAIPDDVVAELQSWVDEVAPSFGLQPADIAQLRDSFRQEPEAAEASDSPVEALPYLLVEISPDSHNQEQFYVEIIFWRSEDDSRPLYKEDNTLHNLEDIPALFNTVFTQFITESGETEFIIEFFLPFELIFQEIDRWKITRRMMRREISYVIGNTYPIIVRSLDRLLEKQQNKALEESWKKKWERLQTIPQASNLEHVFWVCRHNEFEPDALYSLISEDDKACLGLAFRPDYQSIEDTFFVILGAGVPVAFWLRPSAETVASESAQSKIEAVLADKTLVHLPQLILHYRKDALRNKDEAHIANHLTLFWDDPYRIPEKYNVALVTP